MFVIRRFPRDVHFLQVGIFSHALPSLGIAGRLLRPYRKRRQLKNVRSPDFFKTAFLVLLRHK
jgi:hypothetical protein